MATKNDVFLKEVHISNFLSLHDVILPLKRLTILVGANASGKSNVLSCLRLLKRLMVDDELPPVNFIESRTWAGGATAIDLSLKLTIDDVITNYHVTLVQKSENQIADEKLIIGGVEIISVQEGKGEVKEEHPPHQATPYRPPKAKLALKSAGDYGDRPITSALNEFISNWEFYDFEPNAIRAGEVILQLMKNKAITSFPKPEVLQPDDDGSILQTILTDWFVNDQVRFESVNEALHQCTQLKIEHNNENGDAGLYLQEGYKSRIPLIRASDGTLRLLAYYVMLNQSEVPSLIAIEEPERNLHPGALKDIASVLERLSERTQVIITTHSSQLLDTFNPDNLSENLSVLLLRNIPAEGTTVINLEDARNNRESIAGWIDDFGIGSAIFESELLQDVMEN